MSRYVPETKGRSFAEIQSEARHRCCDMRPRAPPPADRMAFEVDIAPMDTERFRFVLTPAQLEAFERGQEEARRLLDCRVVWNVNSTAQGGGVVELLRPLVAYARGAGVDARWMVIEGPPEFFTITKRIHNRLHGFEGDGGPLGEAERRIYEQVLAQNMADFAEHVREGDVIIIHDPQPAGMTQALRDAGASVIWRCHVGIEQPNELTREVWAFLLPFVLPAQVYVFSRKEFVWDGLDHDRVAVIPPTIDVFSPKNVDLDQDTVRAVLLASGIVRDDDERPVATFHRADGTPRRVELQAQMVEEAPLHGDTPVVLQVSRWDALKDPLGVIRGFAEHVPADTGAHLVYAAPSVEAVADDPEGARVRLDAIALWQTLPAEARRRIHLASLPMDDPEENAIMVNALQRHARIVVQKSLAEGFGLTVAEAMWKARPVVASRVGGIQDQIVHGETGLLLDDPRDLAAFGAALTGLLKDPEGAERMGARSRDRVREHFTSPRSLLDYLGVIRRVVTPADAKVA